MHSSAAWKPGTLLLLPPQHLLLLLPMHTRAGYTRVVMTPTVMSPTARSLVTRPTAAICAMMERAPTAVMIAMAVKEPARGVRRVVQYT